MRTSLIGITVVSSFLALSAGAQTPTIGAVANAASMVTGTVAPGMVALMTGTGMSDTLFKNCTSTYPVPTTCNGTSVLVNGKLAPVISAVASQVFFQVPFSTATGTATIQVSWNGPTSNPLSVTVADTAPALYSINGTGTGVAYYYSPGGVIPRFSQAVQSGDTVVLYGTGFGATNPVVADGNPGPDSLALCVAAVTVTVGGKKATVQSAAMTALNSPSHGAPGSDQITIIVPDGLPSGSYPVVATVGGKATQTMQMNLISPPVVISSVINGATYAAGFESGSWVSVKGQNLATTTRIWQDADFVDSKFPTQLDGVSVTINGKPAFVYYVSPTQLNVLAPNDSALGLVQIIVKNDYGSDQVGATLQQYAPGFFPFTQPAGVASNAPVYAAAVHASDGAYLVPANYYTGYVTRSAKPGELIELFGSGFGPTSPAVTAGVFFAGAAPVADLTQLRLSIGGAPAVVQFAGIVGPGTEYQFNVVVPSLPDGDYPLTATIGGQTSQTGISIPVKN